MFNTTGKYDLTGWGGVGGYARGRLVGCYMTVLKGCVAITTAMAVLMILFRQWWVVYVIVNLFIRAVSHHLSDVGLEHLNIKSHSCRFRL